MLRSCVIACSRSYFTPERGRWLVRTHRFSLARRVDLPSIWDAAWLVAWLQGFRHAIRIGGNRNRGGPDELACDFEWRGLRGGAGAGI